MVVTFLEGGRVLREKVASDKGMSLKKSPTMSMIPFMPCYLLVLPETVDTGAPSVGAVGVQVPELLVPYPRELAARVRAQLVPRQG